MHWIASLNGRYDFCIIILAKNIDELNDTYSEIIYKFSKYLLDKELSIATGDRYYPLRYIFGPSYEVKQGAQSTNALDYKPDETDFKIINLIKQNSRLPLLDIAQKLHLAPQTVRARMKNLIKNRIITSFKIRINHKMLGLHHFHTFLNLSNIDEQKEKEIIDFISSLQSTIHIIKGTGKYDLEFESLLKSHFELYEIHSQLKNKFPKYIQNTDSVLIYKIHEINTVKYSV
jgi:DNA-binding Lrp family transcriptional regulator